MAIKNTNLGGTDWTSGDGAVHTDFNDTFDAAYELASTTVWYLNSNFYTAYEDFESESVGAFTTNSDWTISTSGSNSSAAIASSTNAGGSGKELVLTASANSGSATTYATTKNLVDDKHTFVRIGVDFGQRFVSTTNGTATGKFRLTLGGQSTVDVSAYDYKRDGSGMTNVFETCILVIARGSGNYDVYVGGNKIYDNVSEADPQLKIEATATGDGAIAGETIIYVDDVYQSTYSV